MDLKSQMEFKFSRVRFGYRWLFMKQKKDQMDLKSQMKLKFSRVKFCVHVDLYVVDQGSN